jgi:hypothetical protein
MKIFFWLLVFCLPIMAFQPTGVISLSPELSYGVMDNSDAWIEIIPARAQLTLSDMSRMNIGISYSFEVPRDKKPLSSTNHHGFRIASQFSYRIANNVDAFFEVNIGSTVPGAVNDIPYLQNFNYQRVGIRWDFNKVVF